MIPDYQSFFVPVLQAMSDGQIWERRNVENQAADILQISEADRQLQIKTGVRTYISRAGWAITYLKNAGALSTPKRAQFVITQRGKQLLKDHPNGFKTVVLEQFEEFRAFQSKKSARGATCVEDSQQQQLEQIADALSASEHLDAAVESNLMTVRSDLASKLSTYDAYAFERLCVDLMLAMGYGGSRSEFAEIANKSREGGIDGIVKQDALGLRGIYIRAKLWESAVTEKVVRDLLGSLAADKVTDGVIITTGEFTAEAKALASSANANVSLIDGGKLVELMIKYHVGIETFRSAELVKINEDYFDENI